MLILWLFLLTKNLFQSMIDSPDFQKVFLNEVKERLPPGESLAKYLSKVLDVNLPNTYRRINGETPLSLSELLMLSKELHISIDSCLHQRDPDIAIFRRNPFIINMDDVNEYFKSTRDTLTGLKHAGDVELFYAARDLPIFYFMSYPTLCKFKVFLWLRRPEHDDVLKQDDFDYNMVDDDILSLAAEVGQVYAEIPTTELWTDQTIQNMLRQVKYYFDAGSISTAVAIDICDELMELLDGIHRDTAAHSREDPGTRNFNLYYSDFLLLENSVVARVKDQKRAYISYAGINFMSTDHQLFCQQIMDRFDDQKKRSILLSTASDSIRNRFFNRSKQKVNYLKEQVQRDIVDFM